MLLTATTDLPLLQYFQTLLESSKGGFRSMTQNIAKCIKGGDAAVQS